MMYWCPHCRTERDPGKICSLCGCTLSRQLDDPAAPVPVASGLPAVDCQLLLTALREEGIPAYSQVTDPYDAIRKMYSGMTLHGEDVMVAGHDLDAAAELVTGLLSGSGRREVRVLADEIAAMPAPKEEHSAVREDKPPREPGEGPVKYAVLTGLSVVAVVLLRYLAGL